jgi:mono/diheme cytochrome c family protein
MKLLWHLLLFLVLAVAAVAVWIYSGSYNVSANQEPAKFEDWVMATFRDRSIEVRSEGLTAPALDDEARVRTGYSIFSTHCVTCHGAPGVWPDDLAMGLYPVPPSLDSPGVQDAEDGELFWIVKNGIKLTGMPAFGPMQTDDDLWSVVAFLRRLPHLSPEQYKAMRAQEEPMPEGEGGGGTDAGSPAEEGAGAPAGPPATAAAPA